MSAKPVMNPLEEPLMNKVLKAIELNDIEFIQSLSEQDERFTLTSDSALAWAALYNHMSLAKYILKKQKGFHVDVVDKIKFALYWSVRNGNLEMVKYFVEEEGDYISNEVLKNEIINNTGSLKASLLANGNNAKKINNCLQKLLIRRQRLECLKKI